VGQIGSYVGPHLERDNLVHASTIDVKDVQIKIKKNIKKRDKNKKRFVNVIKNVTSS